MVEDLKARIIPTRVGTRKACERKTPEATDHPHACGDKLALFLRAQLLTGSSPRVWGQVILEESYAEDFRIIPTRVGTSDI